MMEQFFKLLLQRNLSKANTIGAKNSVHLKEILWVRELFRPCHFIQDIHLLFENSENYSRDRDLSKAKHHRCKRLYPSYRDVHFIKTCFVRF